MLLTFCGSITISMVIIRSHRTVGLVLPGSIHWFLRCVFSAYCVTPGVVDGGGSGNSPRNEGPQRGMRT